MDQRRTERARELREHQSPPEGILWSKLRNRRLCGFKFRRQQPLGPYFADFYCAEIKMVVELDGRDHVEQREHDRARDQWMRSEGIQVLRIPAWEFSKYPDTVLGNILRRARERAAELLAGAKIATTSASDVRPLTRSARADRPLPQGER